MGGSESSGRLIFIFLLKKSQTIYYQQEQYIINKKSSYRNRIRLKYIDSDRNRLALMLDSEAIV